MPDNDIIIINGDVGTGASIKGSVNANNIAGGNIIISGNTVGTQEQFASLLKDLQALIDQAKAAGELDDAAAQSANTDLEEATTAIESEDKPPKRFLMEKLESVSNTLSAAAEALTVSGKVAKILIKAIPFVALLIRLAERLF
jgi:2-oxoglutarate dehydrogenase complex dehydrogenase (E1) component-like enzyme